MLLMEAFNIRNAFVSLLLLLDSIVYSFVSYVYQVFVYLADFTIFTTKDFQTIANRMYIIVGVVALFLIAFSLLQSLVNPDDISKGKNSPIKVVQNVLISIVLLGVVPTVFNFAYDAQNRILRSQVIQNIILNGGSLGGTRIDCSTGSKIQDANLNSKDGLKKVGNYMAVGVFSSFFTGNSEDPYGLNIKSEDDQDYSLCQAYEDVKDSGDFTIFDEFVKNTRSDTSPENRVHYSMGISLACGVLTFYLLLTFSIGLAVRAIKLAYYQLVAPIPILARIVPQGQKIFDNWLKGTLSTFAEVFIRLLVVFFAILMIQMSIGKLDDVIFGGPDADIFVLLLAKVLLILGFLIFAKKAPEFISNMVGIKSGSLKLGIKDQIREAALIGKPLASTIDKAQGFIAGGITGALGGGWSALKHGGPLGSSMRTGAVTGAAKGGNQFGSQRDAAYHRISGKDGPDTMWGDYERWAKGETKKANDAAKNFHRANISKVENSEDFISAVGNAKGQMLEALLNQQDIKDRKDKFIDSYRQSYVDAEQTKYVDGEIDKIKARRDAVLDEVTSSMDFINTKNRIHDELAHQGIHLSDADLQKKALDEYNQIYNGDDMAKYKELQQAMNLDEQKLEAMRTNLAASFDQETAKATFDSSSRFKDLEKQFEKDIAEEEKLDAKAYSTVVDAYRNDPRHKDYNAAKTYMKDADEREGNKKMADVLKAAIKNNKLDLGGGSKPDADAKGDNKK